MSAMSTGELTPSHSRARLYDGRFALNAMRGSMNARAASTSDVRQIGRPAITRGAAWPARVAAARNGSMVRDVKVCRPVIHVKLPAHDAPAMSSIFGPSAASTNDGVAPPWG
jgi:hypothetical protein